MVTDLEQFVKRADSTKLWEIFQKVWFLLLYYEIIGNRIFLLFI